MTVCRRAACVPPSRFVKVIDVTLVVRQEQEQRHPGSQTTLLPARAASPWFSFSSVTLEPWTLHAYTVGRSHWTDAVARSHFRHRPDTNLFSFSFRATGWYEAHFVGESIPPLCFLHLTSQSKVSEKHLMKSKWVGFSVFFRSWIGNNSRLLPTARIFEVTQYQHDE